MTDSANILYFSFSILNVIHCRHHPEENKTCEML
jgi:hypothetical protein